MSDKLILRFKDSSGFCNVLLSGLGGDGANMAAKMLFQIGVEQYDFDGGYDAQYGSEKKGTPTSVTVRLCEFGVPMRASGPTMAPHVLAIFHKQLIEPLELYRGLQPGAAVIVNTPPDKQELNGSGIAHKLREELRMVSGKLYLVDAAHIAAETNSRLNMPIMALAAQALGFDMDKVREIVAQKWPRAKEANLAAFNRALTECQVEEFRDDGFRAKPPVEARKQIGYLNMLNGGAVNALSHSTFSRNNILSGWGSVPELNTGACHGCGICLTVCSDPGALIWENGKVVGVNPQFCKGCMRCIEVCKPTKLGRALAAPVGETV